MSADISTGCKSPLPAVLLTSTGDGISLSVDELLSGLLCEVLSVLLCELDGVDVSEDELSLLVDEFVEFFEPVELVEFVELAGSAELSEL